MSPPPAPTRGRAGVGALAGSHEAACRGDVPSGPGGAARPPPGGHEDHPPVFLQRISDLVGQPAEVRSGSAYLWRDVPSGAIADLAEAFHVHPLNHDFQHDSIAEHLRSVSANDEHPWAAWNVVLPRNGDSEEVELFGQGPAGLAVKPKCRRILVRPETSHIPPSILFSGRSARVGSRQDIRFALTETELEQARQTARQDGVEASDLPEDACRAVMKSPVLVIYLVRGYLVRGQDKGGPPYDGGRILPALGLHFPGERDPNARQRYVRYRLNRVAQAELGYGDDIPVDEDLDD